MISKNHKIALISLMGAMSLLATTAFATDIPVETYVEGGLTITLNGDWETGPTFTSTYYSTTYTTTATWSINEQADYITFADDTSTPGFYITFDMEDFAYSGSDASQGSLDASNFTLFAQYTGHTASAATIGYDDPALSLSILPNSCSTASASDYTFNNNFTSASATYSLPGSTTSQILVKSTGDCLNIGKIRFDRMETVIPKSSAIGVYSTNFTFTIIDGTAP